MTVAMSVKDAFISRILVEKKKKVVGGVKKTVRR